MKAIKDRLKGFAWYNWVLSALILLYLVFLSLSWLYLPGKLKQVTEIDISKMIGHEITVGDIRFNPFILSLTVQDLSVSDASREPLVAWDNLLVNFGFWKSIFSWEIAYNEIALDNPRVNIIKYKKGFNFSDIIERLSSSDSDSDSIQDKSGGDSSIAIEIFNTSINNGSFKYTDESGTVPATANLNDISILIKQLYFATGDEHLNPFSINAKGQKGGEIELEGNYRIDPLYVEGSIGVKGINMPALSKFLENIVPVSLSKGMLSFDTNILIKKDPDLVLKTDKGNLSINDLLLDDNVPEPAMLSAGNIYVQDISLDLTGQKVMVDSLLLDNITLNQWIDENGRPRYENLLPEKNEAIEQEKPSVAKERTVMPLDIKVRQVSLKNSTINFDDHNEKITRGHSLSGINLDLKDISLAPDSKIIVQLAALLDEKGTVNVDGSMCLSPLSMELNYHLDKILLTPFSDYLESASWLSIQDGSLSVDGNLSMKDGAKVSITADANLGIDDFKIKDTRSGESVFALKTFRIDDIKAETDKKKVSIASVALSKPDLNMSISEEKKINLAGLRKEKETPKTPEAPVANNDQTQSWKYEINKVSLNEGTVLFSDQSVKPVYKTRLYNMTFLMDRFGSGIKEATPFSFKAEIDKYAPFIITGSLDPMNKQPGFAFQSTLKGIEMSHLSPYSGVYIGNNLKSGKLSLNLDYTLHDSKLKGKNNINAKNLYLGEKLPVEPVINAPVRLGLALLRDISGVIDLNVGVSGNIDDPGFSISGVILKALVNIITKAAASPFKILGALIPGGGDNLGKVTFEPGIPSLDLKSKKSLKNLVDALNKKPRLILSIKGNASGQEDIEALKIIHLKQRIAEKRRITLPVIEEELKGQDLWMIAENRPALEAINNEMNMDTITERISAASNPENNDKKGNAENQDALKTEQKVYKQVYNDILTAWKIEEDELISLADERALSIKQYLVDVLKLSHERVSVIKARSSDLLGRIIKLEVDVM